MFGWHEAMQALVFGTDKGPVAILATDLLRHEHGWRVTMDGLRRSLPRVDPPTPQVIPHAPAHVMKALDGSGYGRRLKRG